MLLIKNANLISMEDINYEIKDILVKDGKILARGHNQKEKHNNAILHAEIVALTKAQKKLSGLQSGKADAEAECEKLRTLIKELDSYEIK